jgi:hypothetical protein
MNATINCLLRRFKPPLYTLTYSNNTQRALQRFELPVFTILFFHLAALIFYFPSFPLHYFRKIPPTIFIIFFYFFSLFIFLPYPFFLIKIPEHKPYLYFFSYQNPRTQTLPLQKRIKTQIHGTLTLFVNFNHCIGSNLHKLFRSLSQTLSSAKPIETVEPISNPWKPSR